VWPNPLQLKHPKTTEGRIISILVIVQFRQNGALKKTMPTLYTALRTHLPKPKARKQQPPTSFGLAMIVSVPERKQRRERIYRLSLVQRFKNIHRPSKPRTVIVIGAGLAGLAAAYELHCIGYEVT
jgi:FAD binding domain